MIAFTREVSDALAQCELTHLARSPIDLSRARAQHDAYEQALRDAGLEVRRLPAAADMADSVFIEDTAIVFDDVAIITRPGAESRRRESAAVVEALKPLRELRFIDAPGTIDGGDVLVVGRDVFVGLSSRTNAQAVEQLRRLLPGLSVHAVQVTGCLHLKSAVTALDDETLLVNPAWVSLAGFRTIEVHAGEPHAANALRLPDRLIFPSAFPRTLELLRDYRVVTVDADELAKAEGAVTCCSLLVRS